MDANLRITKMRKVWRLSENQVSEKIGIDIKEYIKLENGTVQPDMNIAMKLCEIFQITLDYLMTGVESEKDTKAINRPLTREEIISDEIEEIKKLYSPKVFTKYYDYLYAIYIERAKMPDLFDRYGRLDFNSVLNINSYDILKELAEKGRFDLHYVPGILTHEHKASTCIDDVLSFQVILDFLNKTIKPDQGFIDYAIKKDPVQTLNYYFLSKKDDLDKEGILKCIAAGGYVEKVARIVYYTDYSYDEYGEQYKTYEFGRDNFATILLKAYCEK